MMNTADIMTTPVTSGIPTSPVPSDGFLNFLKHNIWVPILVGIVIIVVIIILVFIIRKCRNNARFDYTALPNDVDMPLKLDIDRKKLRDEERDTALLNCSFYLRSTGKYSLYDHLPDIGSRQNKHWFLIKENVSRGEKMLNMVTRSPQMPIKFNKASRKILSEFFILFQHPYIFPVDDVDFVFEQELIMVLHSYNPKGSLKDLIYNSNCFEGWHSKYCFRGKPLAPPQIQIYGRQILEGLMYLEEKGIVPFGHLHSGNVILQNQTCRLTGYENVVTGFPSKMELLLKRKLKSNKDAIDVISFGHVLYEMATGSELDVAEPEPRHIINISHQPTVEVLYFIFEHPSGAYPTVKDIAQHDYFKHIVLREMQLFNDTTLHMTQGVKGLLKVLRKGRSKSSNQPHRKSVANETSLVEMSTKPVRNVQVSDKSALNDERKDKSSKRNKRKKSSAAGDSVPRAASHPAPANHDVTVDIPETSTARNALLAEIRIGSSQLKKVANDTAYF